MTRSKQRALPRHAPKYALFLIVSALIVAFSGCAGFFVGPQLTSVSIGPPNPTVAAGQTQQMDATGVYDDNSRKPITNDADWTSSNTAVATVNRTGLVTAVAIGTANISAYDLGYSASTTVTVTDSDLVSISITPTSPSIFPGQSQQFTATGLLQTGNTIDLTKALTWSSSNTSVANIDGYGLAVGSSSITSLSTTDITAKSGSITSNVATLTVQ